jgi:hypothetical protein
VGPFVFVERDATFPGTARESVNTQGENMHTHNWKTNHSTGLAECSCGREAVAVPMTAEAAALARIRLFETKTHAGECPAVDPQTLEYGDAACTCG